MFFFGDVQSYFFPYHVLPVSLMERGELSLWNPYAFSGLPLLGDGQTALFYPPNWLYFVLPVEVALSYATVLQFSIAGTGMFLFLRMLGLPRLPAFVGGVYLGGALAAVQLAPWAELGALRPGAAGASFDMVFNTSMARSEWLLQLFPYAYGLLGPGVFGKQPTSPVLLARFIEHSAYVARPDHGSGSLRVPRLAVAESGRAAKPSGGLLGGVFRAPCGSRFAARSRMGHASRGGRLPDTDPRQVAGRGTRAGTRRFRRGRTRPCRSCLPWRALRC